MRVVQLLPELNEGGVERGVVELSRELVRQGIESIVISRGGRLVPQLERDGARHITFDLASKNPLTAPWRIFALRRLLCQLRPDILHARSRVPAWLGYLANRSLKLPFVTTVHGFNSVNRYSRVMTFGDKVICVSGAIKDHIQRHYQVPEERCVVIPRGIDLDLFNPERLDRDFMTRFAAEHGLAGRFVVTSVGRITQLKDYETFICAIALLREEFPDVLGLIVGGVHEDKKSYFASLQMLIKSNVLERHVRFVGSQSRVAEIYGLSDVVVSSSKKPESFGRSAAEALAMGVPVAASAHGGMLDIVREGETGALFPPRDAQGLSLAIQRSRALPRARLRAFVAANFTLERMVSATSIVYSGLLSSRRSS